jgi:cytochrome c-type biogenesis protein CcmH
MHAGDSFRRHLVLYLGALGAGLVLLWTLLFAPPPSAAQGNATPTPRPVTMAEVNAASQNLYCPVCENLPLAVCYTDACEDWKQQVRDLLAQGYSNEQIEQYFVERFGQKTVGTPTTPIAQLLTVGLPVALIALIGVLIVVNLLQWRRRKLMAGESSADAIAHTTSAAPADDDDYRRRLEAELRDRG